MPFAAVAQPGTGLAFKMYLLKEGTRYPPFVSPGAPPSFVPTRPHGRAPWAPSQACHSVREEHREFPHLGGHLLP